MVAIKRAVTNRPALTRRAKARFPALLAFYLAGLGHFLGFAQRHTVRANTFTGKIEILS